MSGPFSEATEPIDPLPFGIRRYPVVVGASLVFLAVLVVVSTAVGTGGVSVGEAAAALVGRPASALHHTIVVDIRLPRVLVAVVAGGTLALAGALAQAITRNALASPDLTGVSAGVVLVTVLWLAFGPGATNAPRLLLSPAVVGVGAVGGVGSGLLVYALASSSRADPIRLILTGVLVSLLLQTATSFVLMVRGDSATLGAYFWYIGNLNGRSWPHWAVLWPWAAITVPLALGCAGRANVLHLGDDAATALGIGVRSTRAVLFVIAATMTAGALVVVGAIGFVGLIAPHIVRRIVGDDQRRVFPLTFLTGGLLLASADLAARGLTPRQLPTGVVTAIFGAVFFLMLLRRGAR